MTPAITLLGISEIAQRLNMKPGTVRQWNNRGHLPAPDFRLVMGDVWLGTTIDEWQKGRASGR